MKPFTLIVQETIEKIADIINQSNLPAYCLKQILKDLFIEIEKIEKQEVENYEKEIYKNKQEKESEN